MFYFLRVSVVVALEFVAALFAAFCAFFGGAKTNMVPIIFAVRGFCLFVMVCGFALQRCCMCLEIMYCWQLFWAFR